MISQILGMKTELFFAFFLKSFAVIIIMNKLCSQTLKNDHVPRVDPDQSLQHSTICSSISVLISGISCSKLTTSLVNVPLKFQMLISEIHQYFLLKKGEKLAKASLIFFNKKMSMLCYKVIKHLTS